MCRVRAVIDQGQERAAKRVEMRDRGRIGVDSRFLRRVALGGTQLALDALGVPGLSLPGWAPKYSRT